jgi:hypothetical protein
MLVDPSVSFLLTFKRKRRLAITVAIHGIKRCRGYGLGFLPAALA